jgi:aspartyl/asparaginyl beta-hydroxylase (cupin superfamily)
MASRAGRFARDVRALARLLAGHVPRFRDAGLQDLAASCLDGGATWVVTPVNATLRLRRALASGLYLEPRRVLSRARAAARGRAGDAAAHPRLRLTLLCPTRGRVREADRFLRSVARTAAVPDRVDCLFYVDRDDPAVEGYRRWARTAARRYPRLGAVDLRVAEPAGVAGAWNALAARAGGDALLMANDDQVYVDHGWDLALDERVALGAREHPDRALCLYFDAGRYPDGGCDFPIVTRAWYEALGYFTPEIFEQWENERWVFDVARRAGRLGAVPGVFVEHRHFQDFKAPFDATYQRHVAGRRKSLSDHARYLRTAEGRERDASKLRALPGRTDEEVTMTSANGAGDAGLGAYTLQSARRFYSQLIDAWNFGGRYEEARACARLAVEQGLWVDPMQRPREYIAGLGARPTYDPDEFWFTAYLQEHYPRIRAEVAGVIGLGAGGAFSTIGEDRALVQRGNWDQAILFRDGEWQEDVCAALPVTTGIVAGIPEATTLSPGVVTISRLAPGTHLAPHCGASNALLRVHLGLVVPPGPSLRVGEERLTWREGSCLVFDDSFEHEVRHEGDAERVVLILDVLNPALGGQDAARLVQRRVAAEDEVVSFLRERGLERVDARGEAVVFHPNAATSETVRRYMRSTGSLGVELREGRVHWYRPDGGA